MRRGNNCVDLFAWLKSDLNLYNFNRTRETKRVCLHAPYMSSTQLLFYSNLLLSYIRLCPSYHLLETNAWAKQLPESSQIANHAISQCGCVARVPGSFYSEREGTRMLVWPLLAACHYIAWSSRSLRSYLRRVLVEANRSCGHACEITMTPKAYLSHTKRSRALPVAM